MKLSLFFTLNVSLETWVTQGLFDREKLIYEEHLKKGNLDKVYWFTYGCKDESLAEKLKQENKLHEGIEVFQMPKYFNIPKIGGFLYSIALPWCNKNILKQVDVYKTNQMNGSWSAVIAKWLFNKVLIIRTGYTLSQLEYSKTKNSIRYKCYRLIEKFAYKYSDVAFVSSMHNKDYLLQTGYIKRNKIKIVTNFIDISLFRPLNVEKHENKILFVGRLNKEKNLFNLIEAISQTNFTLDIYGQGELKSELMQFSGDKKADVNFMGVVSNKKLVDIYNNYKYYILSSYFEGMPKTLLEAMACGCVCIGTDVKGINEVMVDEVNGFLSSDTSSSAIVRAVNIATKSDCLDDVSINAVSTISSKFSLNQIVQIEKTILSELL